MKAKRTLTLLLVLALMGSMLSGCGGTAAQAWHNSGVIPP